MIQDRNIICIASRWGYDPTGKHHIMKSLSKKNRIIWVNYRGSRKPRASVRDVSAALSTLRATMRGPRQVHENIVELTPLVIPGASTKLLQSLNRRLLVGQIKRIVAQMPSAPIQLWSFAPDVGFLAGRFDEERVIYYCVDEFAAFQDHDAETIQQAERYLIDQADVVLTTSAQLFESRKKRHPNTHLVRHGVDWRHFAASTTRPFEVPPELADLPRPIYGFFGLMSHWFDVALLADVARQRPNASFVLIGDVLADVSRLDALPNVHFLGRRKYEQLPAYCAAFDAALLPFGINEMTLNINPIKLREYLAAGLPVVSTRLPEAALYEPDVLIADDADEFAACCDRAIERVAPDQRRSRSAGLADESWETVIDRLSSIVAATPARFSSPSLDQNGLESVPPTDAVPT